MDTQFHYSVLIGCKYRALVSMGAVDAMAPTLFGNIGIGTHTFWENFTGSRYDAMKHGVEATFTFDKFTFKTEV